MFKPFEGKLIFSLTQMKKLPGVLQTSWRITFLWSWILIIFTPWNSGFCGITPPCSSSDFSSCVCHSLSRSSVLTCGHKLFSGCLFCISLISWTKDLTLCPTSASFMTLFPVFQLWHFPVFISNHLVVASQVSWNSEYIKPHSLSFHLCLLGV